VAAYAQLALRCLIASCPEAERKNLRVFLHLVGFLEGPLKSRMRRLFEAIPGVVVVLDTIRIDEQRTRFDRFRSRWVPQALRHLLLSRGQGNLCFRTVGRWIAGPRPRDYLGMYYHEWISAVCEQNINEDAIITIDSDLFVADQRLFDEAKLKLAKDEFGVGWVWRYPDWVRVNAKAYRPIGTELCIINPKIFSETNCQKHTFDIGTMSIIRNEFPGVHFERSNFIDSIYGPSWLAQLKGFRADTRFGDLNLCHPGGVGHFSPDYLKSVPEHENREEWINLNVRRVRMHHGIQKIIRSLDFEDLVDISLFTKIDQVRDYILSNTELANKWNKLERQPDEKVLDQIATMVAHMNEQVKSKTS
jgi:hypothetical protein